MYFLLAGYCFPLKYHIFGHQGRQSLILYVKSYTSMKDEGPVLPYSSPSQPAKDAATSKTQGAGLALLWQQLCPKEMQRNRLENRKGKEIYVSTCPLKLNINFKPLISPDTKLQHQLSHNELVVHLMFTDQMRSKSAGLHRSPAKCRCWV